MRITIAPPHPSTGRFAELHRNRREPQVYYARWVGSDPRMRGRVLDVGCGNDYPGVKEIRELLQQCDQLDGVDPTPGMTDHPGLTERWCGRFEEVDLPEAAYDALFSFWVAEHIADPRQFMRQAHRALRPGGAFYALAPHALHPFPLAVRLLEVLSVKRLLKGAVIRDGSTFPAFYRLNRLGSVVRAAEQAGFSTAEFHYLPSVQWDTYLPRPLRVLPHLYDRLIGGRFQRAAQVIAYRLEKEK